MSSGGCKLLYMTVTPISLIFSTLACLSVACTSPGQAPSEIDDPAFLSPQADRATLIVVRAGSVPEDGCSYLVALDDKVAGKLTTNGWITMYPSTGTHLLSLRPEGVTCAREVQTRIRVEAARSSRVQLIRAPDGALRWDNEGRVP